MSNDNVNILFTSSGGPMQRFLLGIYQKVELLDCKCATVQLSKIMPYFPKILYQFILLLATDKRSYWSAYSLIPGIFRHLKFLSTAHVKCAMTLWSLHFPHQWSSWIFLNMVIGHKYIFFCEMIIFPFSYCILGVLYPLNR